MLLVIVPIVAIFPLSIVVLIFGTIDMASYVFHLFYGTGGTPWGDLMPYILTGATFWAVFVATIYRIQPWLERIPYATTLLGAAIIALNPLVNELAMGRAMVLVSPQESLVDRFADPVLLPETATPNIVIVYVEGLERTYAEAPFGQAYAPMAQLAEQAVSFTDVSQMTATGWSLAGTTATQCGTPLLLGGATRIQDIDTDARILPGVTCLSDIATAKGYDIWYLSGTELLGESESYYGYGNFFKTHGGAQIIDRAGLADILGTDIPEDEAQGWGFRDQTVLESALAKFRQLHAAQEPFVLNVATMDTHGPQAFMSPACRTNGGPMISDNLLDAVTCSSTLVADFVSQIRALDPAGDTRIVVMSDHLAHHNNLNDTLERFDRRNTVMFLDDTRAGETVDAPGTMVYVFPTLLDWLDWLDPDVPDAGLGVSLFADKPSLRAELGEDDLNERLKLDVELGRHIWRQE